MDNLFDLPPLPDPEAWNTHHGAWGDRSTDYAYTMRQMQAYARAAVEAEREAIANMCEDDPSLAFAGRYAIAAAIRARKERS